MRLDRKLLKKYNKPGPRYTSYPPANFFTEEYKQEDYISALKDSNDRSPASISIYIHMPFCKRLCHFCGCNTGIYKSDEHTGKYVNALKKEINNLARYLDKSRKVSQIHWGGGTPNAIPMHFIGDVMDTIHNNFTMDANAEVAMECSPAYLEYDHIDLLKKYGFNRLSLGVQDFNPLVLKIVNREMPLHPIEDLVAAIKAKGFVGVNLDFVYGLPGQTVESFHENMERAVKTSPDRLVTFSYAHVPWVKAAQKFLEKYEFPSPDIKLSMLESTHDFLTSQGYHAIGMDHFARASDELYISLQKRKLHRNFQGYCTRETTGQVYGFGTTSISQLWGAYSQNVKNTDEYIEAINKNGFAVERGYTLTKEDRIVREVITELMCNNYLDFNEIAVNEGVSVDEVLNTCKFDPESIKGFMDDGLVEFNENIIKVTTQGYFFIRNIAMAFDPKLSVREGKYSQTV